MPGQSHDVIVLGLGAMGSAAAYHLARRGARVLGLEQFTIAHDRGSSHGESRMIRLCYYEHPDYVPLLHRAYQLWHELERDSRRKLLYVTGGLYMGPPDSGFVAGALRAAGQHRLPHESLNRAQIAARFPQFHLPDAFTALYEPNAGFLLPELVVKTHAELASSHGADLRCATRVLAWSADQAGIRVVTDEGEHHAARLVICGGAWSGKLLADLGVALVPRRQVLGWVHPPRPDLFQLGSFPVWAIDHPDGTQHYGFPLAPGAEALKVAHHHHGPPTDPDAVDRRRLPGDEDDFRPALRRFLPGADGPLHETRICMYTTSPDSHFIVDRHPRHENVIIACGFSGHGFKFATVMGEVLADLALEGSTRHPINFLRLRRFADS
jgi:sarcosine oxidase